MQNEKKYQCFKNNKKNNLDAVLKVCERRLSLGHIVLLSSVFSTVSRDTLLLAAKPQVSTNKLASDNKAQTMQANVE